MEKKILVTCDCEAPSVDQLLSHLGKVTGLSAVTTDGYEGDRNAADYADAEPLADSN